MSPDTQHHILVVEDDPDFRANVVEWLQDSGYAVQEAANGREAMEVASDARFEVVITDLKMPEASGLELLDVVQGDAPETAVIFLSGQATVRDAIQALRERGGFDFPGEAHRDDGAGAVIERAIARSQDPPEPPAAAPAPAPLSASPSGRCW